MSDVIEYHPLAQDRYGRRFPAPPEAAYWLLEFDYGSGPPRLVKNLGQPRLLPIDATEEDVEEAVGHRACNVRMTMLDKDRERLDGPRAYLEIRGRNPIAEVQSQGAGHLYGLCESMTQANQQKDHVVSDLTKALMHSHVQLQNGAAELLRAANETIRIANGIEAIERLPPVIDASDVADHLLDSIENDRREPREKPHWVVQLMNSPIGMAAMSILDGFAKSIAGAAGNTSKGGK